MCLYFIAASLEKLLQIILVRDVDGKTFWDALSDAISPRISDPTTADETALSTFRGVFLDCPLKKGALIFLTWLNPSRLLVSLFSASISYGLLNLSYKSFVHTIVIVLCLLYSLLFTFAILQDRDFQLIFL